MQTCLQALRLFLFLTALTGLFYPLIVTAIARVAFPVESTGSLVRAPDGHLVGSSLLAQKTVSPRYFWPRPSAADYATLASGASNLGPTSAALQKIVAERAATLRVAHALAPGAPIPQDLLFASASGLDPHISPAAARFQITRVAEARGLAPAAVAALVERVLEPGGLLGEDRVNVVLLNLALDQK